MVICLFSKQSSLKESQSSPANLWGIPGLGWFSARPWQELTELHRWKGSLRELQKTLGPSGPSIRCLGHRQEIKAPAPIEHYSGGQEREASPQRNKQENFRQRWMPWCTEQALVCVRRWSEKTCPQRCHLTWDLKICKKCEKICKKCGPGRSYSWCKGPEVETSSMY